ncbi:MAG: TraX family protein [Herbinix sp.]|nr:TraX family protein [Herbinix sp.]
MDGNTYTSVNTEMKTSKRGISGSTLKLIAIFTMLIDHIGAAVIDKVLAAKGMYNLDASDIQATQTFLNNNIVLYIVYFIMRLIGRLAFPIFCFLLVEGFLHTRNRQKYAIRLAIFSLVSEIPFDLAIFGKTIDMSHQNVFFTLLIGLLVMIGFKAVSDKKRDKKLLPAMVVAGAILIGCVVTYYVKGLIRIINIILTISKTTTASSIDILTLIILTAIFSSIALLIYAVMNKKSSLKASVWFADLGVLAAGMLLAELLKTDYSGFGVLTIAIMYGLRKSYMKSMLGGCITLTILSFSEFTAFFDLILIRFYNGKRGINLKYIFYLFYPVHLFLLYLICYFMKLK